MNVVLERASRGWKVRVIPAGGNALVYRYATLAQARFFVAVFSLGPPQWPTANRVRERARKAVSEAATQFETLSAADLLAEAPAF
ncbi:MAG: hypothetical protein M3Y59_07935 [Myxococcota bacterium]|nr:hypothetical protein [Myxococcota bacterium]